MSAAQWPRPNQARRGIVPRLYFKETKFNATSQWRKGRKALLNMHFLAISASSRLCVKIRSLRGNWHKGTRLGYSAMQSNLRQGRCGRSEPAVCQHGAANFRPATRWAPGWHSRRTRPHASPFATMEGICRAGRSGRHTRRMPNGTSGTALALGRPWSPRSLATISTLHPAPAGANFRPRNFRILWSKNAAQYLPFSHVEAPPVQRMHQARDRASYTDR